MDLEIKKCNKHFYTVKAGDEWDAQRLIDEFMQDQLVMDRLSMEAVERSGYDWENADEEAEKRYADAEQEIIAEILGKGDKLEQLKNLIAFENCDYSARFVEEAKNDD